MTDHVTDVDGYLAGCGPPFCFHELASEQQADYRTLNSIIYKPDILTESVLLTPTSKDIRETSQQQTQSDTAQAVALDVAPSPVPVTRGKRGLCYDLNQVSDTKLRDRLLKNRERADQSRKKKLETMKQYEKLLAERDEENKKLMDVNAALLKRIAEMEEALGRRTANSEDAQTLASVAELPVQTSESS
jgi:hypothetical protein